MGLSLEKTTAPVEMVVVEKLDQTPTAELIGEQDGTVLQVK